MRELVNRAELPEHFLEPSLLVHCLPLFLQGRFESAVFEAYKTLEVAIRSASGLGEGVVGVGLATKAFNPDSGPLTDFKAEGGAARHAVRSAGFSSEAAIALALDPWPPGRLLGVTVKMDPDLPPEGWRRSTESDLRALLLSVVVVVLIVAVWALWR